MSAELELIAPTQFTQSWWCFLSEMQHSCSAVCEVELAQSWGRNEWRSSPSFIYPGFHIKQRSWSESHLSGSTGGNIRSAAPKHWSNFIVGTRSDLACVSVLAASVLTKSQALSCSECIPPPPTTSTTTTTTPSGPPTLLFSSTSSRVMCFFSRSLLSSVIVFPPLSVMK